MLVFNTTSSLNTKIGAQFGEVESMDPCAINSQPISFQPSEQYIPSTRFTPDFESRNLWGDGDADGGEPRRGRLVEVQLVSLS